MKTPPKITKLQTYPELYRAGLNCRIGRDAIEGKTKPPDGSTPTEYALYCLLHAVEEISEAMMKDWEEKQ